jgi:pheromone shutdown protein TraB
MWLTVNLFAYFQLKEMGDVDMLTLVIQEMSKQFPTLMETLVQERDQLVVFCLHLFL